MHSALARTSMLLLLLAGCAAGTAGDAGPDRDVSEGRGGRQPTADAGGAVDTGTDASSVDASADGSGGADATSPDAASPDASGPDAPDAPDSAAPDATADVAPDAAPDADDDAVGVNDDCEEIVATAEPVFRPVDIVWVIDTSGSMGQEIDVIEREMANFVAFIAESSLDYRVVLIAADPPLNPDAPDASLGVCLPEPLSGAPGCPDTDSERYRHVREVVGSDEGLEVIAEEWDRFADFLRPGASTHFVVVSDDESGRRAAWFRERIDPRVPQGYTFHSIVSLEERETDCFLGICDIEGCEGPYGSAEARGTEYIILSRETGGLEASICDADWAPIFDGIATGVVEGAALPCDYEIPEIPGREVVYDRVEVTLTTPDAGTVTLERVDDASGCTGSADQWYYDDNEAPTRVLICPGACGERAGELDIGFDCVKR